MLGAPAPVPMRIPLLILFLLNVAAAVLVLGGRDGPAISESSAVAPRSAAGPHPGRARAARDPRRPPPGRERRIAPLSA